MTDWTPVTQALPPCTDGPYSDFCRVKGPDGEAVAYYRGHPQLWRRADGELVAVTHWRMMEGWA